MGVRVDGGNAPWGDLAIFYRDFDYSPGLVTLGRIDSRIETLAPNSGDFAVTITRSDEPAD